MKTNNYRDYVVEAMRYYAYCGAPGDADLRKLKDSLLKSEHSSYYDLEAVHSAMKRLESEEYGSLAVECVRMVYFVSPTKPPARNEISARVSSAAKALFIGESTVYRALRRARTLVALERGLRITDDIVALKTNR